MNENYQSVEWRENVPYETIGQFKVAKLEEIAKKMVEERKAKKQSLIVMVTSKKSDKHKDLNNTIRFCVDPITGIMFGIKNGVLPDGNIKWRAVLLQEINTYNLNLHNDAMVFAMVRMHPKVDGSPLVVGETIFQIVDNDRLAAEKTARFNKMANALHYAKTLKKESMLGFGRYLGLVYPFDATPEIIRASLLEAAVEDPVGFIEKYQNPNRRILEIIQSARTCGVISHDYEKGFKYKSIVLGHGESEMLVKLLDDTTLVDAINLDIAKKDMTFRNLQKMIEKDLDKDDNKEGGENADELKQKNNNPEDY